MNSSVPDIRIRVRGDAQPNPNGEFVLYWMTANRRPNHNFALERAADWARDLGKPLLVLEALRCGYEWASDRLHAFFLGGMADNARAFGRAGAAYYPYVEPKEGAGKGLLAALSERACVVVADDHPLRFLRHMADAGARQCGVRFEQVDSCGLYPLAAADRDFTVAHSFRRHLHKTLRPHLDAFPKADPLAGCQLPKLDALPADILARWPRASAELLAGKPGALAKLPIDHSVPPVDGRPGGFEAGRKQLRDFIASGLDRYGDDRNKAEADASSGLSAWLRFGHVSAHEMFELLAERENWTPAKLAPKPTGQREGWWNMGRDAEEFLDEIVTWRELGYAFCHRRPDDYDDFDSLPDWALETLRQHAGDPREHLYGLERLEGADTADPLWNAAQNQLREEGRIHNYLRMLWGKKVLAWTESPPEALETLVHLNNKYALDGRDPNSYSGIFWVFGRFDRAWGPERPIYGKVRYMTSKSARTKHSLEGYIKRHGGETQTSLF